MRAAARAADMNLRGLGIVSRYITMARVLASPASMSRQSPTSTSAMSPSDTICEKPTLLSAAQSISEVAMAPDWDSSAMLPGWAAMWAKLALSLSGGIIRPTVFGPMMRKRLGRAASSIAWRRPFSRVSPAVMTTPARVPFSDRSRMMPATVLGGVTMTPRSGMPGSSVARRSSGGPPPRSSAD